MIQAVTIYTNVTLLYLPFLKSGTYSGVVWLPKCSCYARRNNGAEASQMYYDMIMHNLLWERVGMRGMIALFVLNSVTRINLMRKTC